MFKPININDIPDARNRRNLNYKKEIDEFISSGESAAEIVIPDNCRTISTYSVFGITIKRNSYPVSVIKRGDRVFLIKEEKDA